MYEQNTAEPDPAKAGGHRDLPRTPPRRLTASPAPSPYLGVIYGGSSSPLKRPIHYDNSAVTDVLAEFMTLSEARDVFPGLDDILAGVANLDYHGNRRPFGKRALFHLLQVLPVISVDGVSAASPLWSRGHCSKVCMALRVASKAFASHLHRLATQNGGLLPTPSPAEAAATFRLLALRLAVPQSRLVTCRQRLLRPITPHMRRPRRSRSAARSSVPAKARSSSRHAE